MLLTIRAITDPEIRYAERVSRQVTFPVSSNSVSTSQISCAMMAVKMRFKPK